MLLLAELNGFIKTLVIILLVYFALRFLSKLLWPYLVRYIKKKAGEKMESAFKGFQQQAQNRQQPQNPSPEVPKQSKKVVGEYIDYEEVE